MELLRPGLLVFALAALVPLWLHLRGRRNAPQLAFSALRFLLEQDPRRARALRLRERALIALRMLAAGGISVALAGPLLPSCGSATSDGAALLGDEPTDLVLVLDDSLSMRTAMPDGGTRWQAARSRALALLAGLPRGSRAALVRAALPAEASPPQLSEDLRSVASELRAMQPRAARDDGERALGLAARVLSGSERGRIVVVGDLEAAGWKDVRGAALGATVARGIGVDVLRVGGPVADTAIVAAVAEPAPDRGAREVRLLVDVARSGDGPFVGSLVVTVGQREVRRRVEVATGETRRIELPVVADAPVAHLALAGPDDALADDDARVVRLAGDDALRVGLVNGAPRPVPREDEVFFLRRALEVGAPGLGTLALEDLRETELDAERLQRLDVLILANVAELPPAALAAVVGPRPAGRGGGGTRGAGAARAASLGWLGGLLPDRIGEALPGPADPGVQPGRPSRPDPAAALLAARLEGLLPALADLRVQRRLGWQPTPQLQAQTALRFADGTPAVYAETRGRGRLVVLGTSADLDWGDLPLQPGFVPLAASLCTIAAGQGAERATAQVAPGEPLDLPRREEAIELRLRALGGELVGVTPAPAERGTRRRWRLPGLAKPGVYEAEEIGAAGSLGREIVVVVPDPAERPLAQLEQLALPTPPPDAARAVAERRGGRPSVPVAPYALVLLLALLVAEGARLWRGPRRGGAR